MINDTRKVQLKCLEILDIVDGICRRNNIKYSLCGGSVVGAYLYKGCLPWDDDIDLMMTRENYNRFLEVVKNELPKGFSVNNYQLSDVFWTPFTKIVNDNTTVIQQDGTVSGVFLDITVYDKVPKGEGLRKKIDVFLWKVSQIIFIGKQNSRSPKALIRNLVLDVFLKDKRRYMLFFQRQVEKNSPTSDYCYSELFGAYCNTKPYEPHIFENYTEIEFENKKYMTVRDYVDYLENRYERTDFREPEDKQKAPHYRYVNLDIPYRSYGSCSINNEN